MAFFVYKAYLVFSVVFLLVSCRRHLHAVAAWPRLQGAGRAEGFVDFISIGRRINRFSRTEPIVRGTSRAALVILAMVSRRSIDCTYLIKSRYCAAPRRIQIPLFASNK